jgi:hypothetical protein
MSRGGLFVSLVLVGMACAGSAAAQDTCGDPFRVTQRSFHALPEPTRHAAVWVDNIPSKLLGGFKPFQVYVIVGNLFPPFPDADGTLRREEFERAVFSRDTRREGPLVVDSSLSTTLTFTSNNRQFTLKPVAVHSVVIGQDAVTFRVCRR